MATPQLLQPGYETFGWRRDLNDSRDFNAQHPAIHKLLGPIGAKLEKELPGKVDLRQWASPVANQGNIQSCTAHATSSVIEYIQRRLYDAETDPSRLFIYKNTRVILGWQGDGGGTLRAAVGSLRLVGAPPEKYLPYDTSKYDAEPSAFTYSVAHSYRLDKQFRLDLPGKRTADTLNEIKELIARGLPTVFGYSVYLAVNTMSVSDGKIPLPTDSDLNIGGHAMAVFGYDDEMVIVNPSTGGTTTKGALLCKNSRGPGWGEQGYAWLPYEYVLKEMAVDWWAMPAVKWIDDGQFSS